MFSTANIIRYRVRGGREPARDAAHASHNHFLRERNSILNTILIENTFYIGYLFVNKMWFEFFMLGNNVSSENNQSVTKKTV